MTPGWMRDPDTVPPHPFRGSMVAYASGRIIGIDGVIPWNHPLDVKRLWRLTRGAAIVLGRLTWKSMPRRATRRCRPLVLSSRPLRRVETFASLPAALAAAEGETVWFLGGTRVYQDAFAYADFLDVTLIPDRLAPAPGQRVATFPRIDPARWEPGPDLPDPDDPGVIRRRYRRRPIPFPGEDEP